MRDYVCPGFTKEFELEFVHVGSFAVEEDEEGEFGHTGGGLPAEDGVPVAMAVGLALVLEVGGFYFLPALHYLCAAAKIDFSSPVVVELCGG